MENLLRTPLLMYEYASHNGSIDNTQHELLIEVPGP